MTRPSKRKISAKEQERESNGRFAKKAQIIDDWGDDEDSGWDDHNNSWDDHDNSWDDHDNSWDGHDNSWDDDLSNEKKVEVELVWSNDAHLEKKRGSYLTGKTKKSTYFDKYGPSGSFTKAAKGTAKITTFLNKSLVPDDFDEIFDELENERNNQLDLNERIEQLKKELKEQQKLLTVTEYNKKKAVFEYLNRLDNNGKGKQKASMEAAQLIFIESAPYRARTIRYWANYWLQHNHLPISHQGKHQKTIRLIDDEDIAERCNIWIRSQGGITTPLKFKEFVEQNLLIDSGIMRKKTIGIATATRWLNVLGYFFQAQKQGKLN